MDRNVFCKAVKGYHHIALTVSDTHWDRVVEFYRGIGFHLKYSFHHPSGNGKRMAFLESEKAGYLELFGMGTGQLPDDRELMHTTGKFFHMCLAVDKPEDVDAVYELLLSLGAKERIAPRQNIQRSSHEMDSRVAFVYGLEREIIEVIYLKVMQKKENRS